ncbi:MarR family winged helix-turn-helix transcriptional regulator [Indiicoccus explosivorum]|uniref:MarR family winged helix-turn-helix transcriptional regulator n=1 Tax=Indiicoccus explosivorum TaxID=1917864 RepID=UPI000B44ACC1|nr:MarR family transcriptional regulator [Indiicoccus explosivorum]
MKNDLFHEIHQKARLSVKEANVLLKRYGLYSSQWSILALLKRRGPMSQTDIWQYLNVEAPTVTRTVIRLEEQGWVVRKEGRDKRERIVQLTEKSEGSLADIAEQIRAQEEFLLSGLTDEEQELLLTLLRKINADSTGKEGLDG